MIRTKHYLLNTLTAISLGITSLQATNVATEGALNAEFALGTGNVNLTAPITLTSNASLINTVFPNATTVSQSGGSSLTTAGFQAIGINNSGTVIIDAGLPITGSGSYLINGTGTVQINAGQNLPAGSINIVQGNFEVNYNASIGNAVFFDSGSIIVNSGFDAEISGPITNYMMGGLLVKNGAGKLILSGPNSHTGGLNLLDGSLAVRSGSGLGSGVFSSSGPRTLELGDGVILSNPFNGFSVLDIEVPSGSAALTGPIMMGSAINKIGAGSLTLGGNVSLSSASAQEGTLLVNGELTITGGMAALEVSDGATLKGSGTVNGLVAVYSGGKVAPGNSPGTLTVGSYISLPGSTLQIEITPTLASQLIVQGDVGSPMFTVDGVDVVIVPNPGLYSGVITYPIISYGGNLYGQFNPPTFNSALITSAKLEYIGNQVFLVIGAQGFASVVPIGNGHGVGVALDVIAPTATGAMSAVIANLATLNTAQLTKALNLLQGSQYKSASLAAGYTMGRVQDALRVRFNSLLDGQHCSGQCGHFEACRNRFNAWVDVLGEVSWQDSVEFAQSPQVGYRNNTVGAVAGFDMNFSELAYLGLLGGYSHSNLNWKRSQGSGDLDAGYAGFYLSLLGSRYYLNTSVIGSWNGYEMDRRIVYPGMNQTAHTSHDGNQILAHIDTGLNLGWGGITVRPFDSLNYMAHWEDAFKEHGAGAVNLFVQKSSSARLRNELGVNLARCHRLEKSRWMIDAKLSWVREIQLSGSKYTQQFVDTGVNFTTTGYMPDRNLISPGATVSAFMLDERLELSLYYDGQFAKNFSDQSFGIQGGYKF